MKIIEDLKEEINKSIKEIKENTNKQLKEINKTTEDEKMEIEAIKEIQIEIILKVRNPCKQTGMTDVSITKKIKRDRKKISGLEDTIEERDILSKGNVKSKTIAGTEHPGHLGNYEKTKTENNRNRRRRYPAQNLRKYLQQNHRRIPF